MLRCRTQARQHDASFFRQASVSLTVVQTIVAFTSLSKRLVAPFFLMASRGPNRGREFSEALQGFVPSDAGVGDALSVH